MIIPIHLDYYSVFAVKAEKTVIVDTGPAGSGEKILQKLAEKGIAKDDISLILITHGHTDHSGGAARLKELTGAPVAVHSADAQWVRSGTNPPVTITSAVSHYIRKFIDEKAAKGIVGCEPDILFDADFSLEPYGVDAKVVHTPGHTKGSVSVLTPEKEVIAGDLIMGKLVNQLQPRWPFFAENSDEVRQSLELLLSMGVKLFYTGHGGPFERRAIERLMAEP
jgi:glyoxylase-like metal-dependent hydrolase (beta-lactamase superfamily II)